MVAEIISINLTHEPGAVYATSDALSGFYVSDRDEASVLAVVPEAIRVWYSADGSNVTVYELDDVSDQRSWAAVLTVGEG